MYPIPSLQTGMDNPIFFKAYGLKIMDFNLKVFAPWRALLLKSLPLHNPLANNTNQPVLMIVLFVKKDLTMSLFYYFFVYLRNKR